MATAHGFVDRASELNFILTVMDGRQRLDLLGVKRYHYSDESSAQVWYDQLRLELNSEGCSEAAKQSLDRIYRQMTGKA